MFEVFLSPRAGRDLKSIAVNDRQRIFSVFEHLETSFYPKHHDVKKLKGYDCIYRVRAGKWRIIYEVDITQKEIHIEAILPRKIAYR